MNFDSQSISPINDVVDADFFDAAVVSVSFGLVAVAVAVAVADHFAAVGDQIVGFVDAAYETFHFSFSSQISQCTAARCTSTKGQQPMYR